MNREFLWYLASPYSYTHEDSDVVAKVLDMRFRQVASDAAALMRMGFTVFSPIAHTHPIAEYGDIEHGDYTIWLAADKVIHTRADGIIVDMMPGWQSSYGVSEEVDWARAEGKPIFYYEPKLVYSELVDFG